MIAWLPFIFLSGLILTLAWQRWQLAASPISRLKQLSLLGFIWILTAFCYTPTAYNFSGDLILHYIQWGPVKLNLVPFQQLDIEFWLNVLLTVPLGALIGWNFPHWSWRRIILLGLVTGLSLELGQCLLDWLVNLGRWVETDDLITNWVGVLIGFGLYQGICRLPGFRWLQK